MRKYSDFRQALLDTLNDALTEAEVRGFQMGLIKSHTGLLETLEAAIMIDGCATYECQKAVRRALADYYAAEMKEKL